jgi:hypothetical protein
MIGVPSVITQRVPKSTISDALRDQQHAGSPRPLVISQRPKEAIRMIVIKLATAGFLGTSAVSARAQVPTMDTAPAAQAGIYHGEHDSLLHSKKASNIVSADTNGGTAPTLPSSALSLDAPSRDYLRAARVSNHWKWRSRGLSAARSRLPWPECRVATQTSLKSGTRFTLWAMAIVRVPSRSSTGC